MQKRMGWSLAAWIWIASCFSVFGTAATADDLLNSANARYDQRAMLTSARESVTLYQQSLQQDQKNYTAAWRLSRACWFLGDHVPKAERLGIYQQGKTAGETAVQIAPDRVEGHYWLAVCLGRIGEEQGVLNSLFLVDPMVRELGLVLAQEPKHGRAQHVLGVIYRKAPGWPLSCGDLQKSLTMAKAAIEHRPDVVLHYVGKAETLIALGRKNEAAEVLTLANALPGPPDEQPETQDQKIMVKDLIAKLVLEAVRP